MSDDEQEQGSSFRVQLSKRAVSSDFMPGQ